MATQDLYLHLGDRFTDTEGDMFARDHLGFTTVTGLGQTVNLGDVNPPPGAVAGDLDVEASHGRGLCRRKEPVFQRPAKAVQLKLLSLLFRMV
jgi:hypothetical protein